MIRTLFIILALCFIPSLVLAGSIDLDYYYTTEMTDAAATVTRYVDTKDITDVIVTVSTDKGSTIVITPVLIRSDNAVVGPASDTTTIANGGDTIDATFSRIGSPKAKVVVTKTESGTTSGFCMTIRGIK